jgi:transcriptional regulator with XRE-family HTH domain
MLIQIRSASRVFHFDTRESPNGISQLLKTLREEKGLTVREVIARLGYRSKTAYLQYEQGLRTPSLELFEKLIFAIDPAAKITVKITA